MPTTRYQQEIDAAAKATADNVAELLERLPTGFTRTATDQGTTSYGTPARWDYNHRSHVRLVTTPADGIEIYKFGDANQVLAWSARFDSATPASFILAALETL